MLIVKPIEDKKVQEELMKDYLAAKNERQSL